MYIYTYLHNNIIYTGANQIKREKSTYKEETQTSFKFYHFEPILNFKPSQSDGFWDYCIRPLAWDKVMGEGLQKTPQTHSFMEEK